LRFNEIISRLLAARYVVNQNPLPCCEKKKGNSEKKLRGHCRDFN
jgi:hypothetical protein